MGIKKQKKKSKAPERTILGEGTSESLKQKLRRQKLEKKHAISSTPGEVDEKDENFINDLNDNDDDDDDDDSVNEGQNKEGQKQKHQKGPAKKSAEEAELENELFGNNTQDTLPATTTTTNVESDENDEMDALMDDQLFVVDSMPGTVDQDSTSTTKNISQGQSSSNNTLPATSSKRKQAAWFDPADSVMSISLKEATKLRKLRQTANEDQVSGVEYEARLRQQYEKMNPTPNWVSKSRETVFKKKNKKEKDSEQDQVDDMIDDALRVVDIDGRKRKVKPHEALPPQVLDIERLRDGNYVAPAPSKTNIEAVDFHPSLDILMTATEDRRLRLFNIDGTRNPLLQSVHVPELPITSARFSPTGRSILMTGPRPFYYTYDVEAGQVIKSPRGLLNAGLGGSDGQGPGGMSTFAFDPNGTTVAIAGRRGHIHLVDWGKSAGQGQVIGDFKANSAIKGLTFSPSTAGSPSKLMALCDDGEAYIWDVGMRRCIGRFNDEGGLGGGLLAVDPTNSYVATGQTSGVVNVYKSDSLPGISSNLDATVIRDPKPQKAIMNLTTSVTSMRFHPDSQLLAISSRAKRDALKMVHLPSLTVFSNWPTAKTPLGHIRDIAFSSRNNQYMAIGNDKGKVLLYSLQHYQRQLLASNS